MVGVKHRALVAVWKEGQTDRQTDWQTGRLADRQTGRLADRLADWQTVK